MVLLQSFLYFETCCFAMTKRAFMSPPCRSENPNTGGISTTVQHEQIHHRYLHLRNLDYCAGGLTSVSHGDVLCRHGLRPLLGHDPPHLHGGAKPNPSGRGSAERPAALTAQQVQHQTARALPGCAVSFYLDLDVRHPSPRGCRTSF